ncbi:MAG: hypothetical protein P1U34_01280 [Coxiellaceae bacterium]|nr:hypothetical protein [Coxiellaceae bacterium]
MKRINNPLLALAVGSCLTSAAFAQEYQQAIPDDAVSQKVPSVIQVVKPNTNNKKQVVAQAADSQIAVLMSKIMQLNKEIAVNQQNATQRIDNIKDTEAQLANAVQKMQNVIQVVDKQVQSLKTHHEEFGHSVSHQGWVASMKQQWGPSSFYAGLGASAALLLMLAWFAWPKNKLQPKPVARSSSDDQAEYDFMATSEAIPAKLDLARAYLAMEDYASAKGVCAEVFRKGDEQQKQQAQTILAEITKKDNHAE